MTKQTKILIGVGVVALAYYFYTKRGKGSSTTTQTPLIPTPQPSTPTSDGNCPSGFKFVPFNCIKAPCGGSCVPMDSLPPKKNPMSNQNTYRLKQDFSRRFPIGQSGSGGATYRKGEIIEASTNPYAKNSSLYTTYNGSLPNFDTVGQIWIEIPSDILEKV